MDQKIYSRTWCEQSRYISSGFNDPSSAATLTFAKTGGEGLCWETDWQDQRLKAWCDTRQWRSFVECKIPHDVLDEIETALLQIVSRWCWDSVSTDLERANVFDMGSPVSGVIDCDWYPVLTVRAADKCLEFALPEWPVELLRRLSLSWHRNETDGGVNPVKMMLPVIAGWTVLPWGQIQHADVGCILFPSGMSSERCYVQMNNTLVELAMTDNTHFSVVAIHNDSDGITVENESSLTSLHNIPITVMIEIARVGMDISQLGAMRIGDCLTLDLSPGNTIRLVVNGCVVGHGDLVRLEERMGVRITQLF